jgi:hypothetical protein
MKCIECGITIPEVPEDASYEEMLCDTCYQYFLRRIGETANEQFEKYGDFFSGGNKE